MGLLEERVSELLEQTPGSRILIVAATPERRREVEERFKRAWVVAITPEAALYGECYDAVVVEVSGPDWRTPWFDEVLPTRLKPYAATLLVTAET
jgi:hypothetical protein